ncbi:hypothetical protein QQX98_004596 [Neonectria punicea]|uniref:Uncharacterized protein n=1 Tax=Neonectria punicea TaxID=979145 RepID=A0ABR1H8W8_9HYPO
MVTILRSHTSLNPEAVSYGFHSPSRFPGEEKDICGRWDAETPAVRELFKQGYARIPTRWKHPFCHTAVQAVCHSVIAIFGSPASPNINAQSGLFLRRCTECGMELKLGPLHTLVITAFYLAQQGMPGETLFGALAVMICLLTMGADVSRKANISVEEILRSAEPGRCHHAALSPLELMKAVPNNVMGRWSAECQTGWTCFLHALDSAETYEDWNLEGCPGGDGDGDSDSSSEESPDEYPCFLEGATGIHSTWLKLPCKHPRIGLLWATIQTEMLTYRRLREGDAWISENFSMEGLKNWLEGNSEEFLTPLVQGEMMKEHTPCGWIGHLDEFLCPTAQEVCTEHFMNMDCYARASFLERYDLLESWEHVQYLE